MFFVVFWLKEEIFKQINYKVSIAELLNLKILF